MKEIVRGAMNRTNLRTFRAALFRPVVVAWLVHFGLAAERAYAHGAAARATFAPMGDLGSPVSPGLVPVHGDADWIKRGGYRDRDGDHCCGKDDCHRLSPGEVHEIPGGFNLYGRFIPRAEAQPSEDGQYWACYSMFKFRCFFYPVPRF